MSHHRLAAALSLALTSLCISTEAYASCGLDSCPWPMQSDESQEESSLGRVEILLRHNAFSLEAESGTFQESVFRFELYKFKKWKFGAWIAPVILHLENETRTGITSPVVFVERGFVLNSKMAVSTALQVEIPLGDGHDGIASSHMEILPYVGVSYINSMVIAELNAGYAFAAVKGHGHDHGDGSPTFVNPHEDKEAMARLALMAPQFGKLKPGLHVNGRYALVDSNEDKLFLTAALVSGYQLTDSLNLMAHMEAPLFGVKRFDWRVACGVAYTF